MSNQMPTNYTNGAAPSSLAPTSANTAKPSRPRTLARTLARFDPGVLKRSGSGAVKSNTTADGGRYDARFKIVLLGDSGVGKTSLIRAAVGEPFNPTMISTIGIDFVEKIYNVDNYRIQLQIWDTAGQERYRSLATSTFRDAKGFIIVYDITNRASFSKIRDEWLRMTDPQGSEPAPVFFAGNKADLLRLKEVPTEEAERLSQQQYAHGFFETSALTGANVQSLFQAVATAMVSTWSLPQLHYQATPSMYNGTPFRLSDQAPQPQRKRRSTVFQCCST